MGEVGAIRLHAMAAGIKVFASQNVFRVEHAYQFVAGKPGHCFVHFQHNVLVVRALAFVICLEGNAWDFRQSAAVRMVIAMIDDNKLVDAFERGEAHGGADFGHFSVRADVNHVVVTAEAEIAHQAHLRGQGVVIGENRATLKSVKELCGVEAEDFAATEAANQFAFIRAAECVGGVKQKL